jgi:hypothetical protein
MRNVPADRPTLLVLEVPGVPAAAKGYPDSLPVGVSERY